MTVGCHFGRTGGEQKVAARCVVVVVPVTGINELVLCATTAARDDGRRGGHGRAGIDYRCTTVTDAARV